ncbi:major facilitator superfamily domain-containing protein [Aspergillus ambiguus]|uniref:MFS transporter n=1 Tax=Aspergillus ambiguus TaxID=176160 RepID=UPI003CCD87FA
MRMESFFQYRQICLAVQNELEEVNEKCTCEGYMIGLPHFPRCVPALRGADDGSRGSHAIPSCQLSDSSLGIPPSKDGGGRYDSTKPIVVGWSGKNDPHNPANFTTPRKVFMTLLVSLLAISVTAASSIDACGVLQYSEYFHVSDVVGSLATGLFLIGFGVGSLLSGPFSETFGRNAVYLITMLIFLIFTMASALAPNLHSHLIFRFFAGFFGSTPLTCAGGTVADLWDPLQKTYAFPLYTVPAFGGPIIGQIIGGFIPATLGWRWLEWIMLIMGGLILVLVTILQPETYGNLLLHWKATALRKQTGDSRYKGPMELRTESLGYRLMLAVYRTFVWSYSEPIIILMGLYLTVIYIVLFTFLEGYTFIFGDTYSLPQGLTSMTWIGMLVGVLLVSCIVPVVYSWTCNEYRSTFRIRPETRLWYAMLGGAPAVPVSLFWMGWTSYSDISIWSPLIASALFGFGITTIFIVAYMYIIDSYGVYSASALGFVVFSRYLVAGGMTVAGAPIYRSIGVQYTLTILGAISAVMAMIPYLLYFYGPSIRKFSKHAANKE